MLQGVRNGQRKKIIKKKPEGPKAARLPQLLIALVLFLYG